MDSSTKKKSGDTAAKKRARLALRKKAVAGVFDPEKLAFPIEIAPHIGIRAAEINAFKALGCPFFGRKTSVAWVRAWLATKSGAAALLASSPSGGSTVAS